VRSVPLVRCYWGIYTYICSLESGRSWAHDSSSAGQEMYCYGIQRPITATRSRRWILSYDIFTAWFCHFMVLLLSHLHQIVASGILLWGFPAKVSYVLLVSPVQQGSSSYRGCEPKALHIISLLSRWKLVHSFSLAIFFLGIEALLKNGRLGSSPVLACMAGRLWSVLPLECDYCRWWRSE
jgi:hypothetical protein